MLTLVCLFNGRGCGAGCKHRYSGVGAGWGGPNNFIKAGPAGWKKTRKKKKVIFYNTVPEQYNANI